MYQLPEMILFDYGQTLIAEERYDALKGNQALLNAAAENPDHVTASQVQKMADELLKDMNFGRNEQELEVTDQAFNRYLYEYLNIKFDLPEKDLEMIFWDAAAPSHPTPNIQKLLEYLYQKGIRTAVVSNMMYSKEALTARIEKELPDNHFEFILTSSDYVFRKPHKRIFDMALRKAGLAADKIWFCGDNLICDVEGSYQAGMHPVWYPSYRNERTEMNTKIPFVTVKDWKEVIEMIESQSKCLLALDKKDYKSDGTRFVRDAVRGIIAKEGKYAMIHSRKYGEYKFPGGGMKPGETKEETLKREVQEETGLLVIPETADYLGYARELRKGDKTDIMDMTSYYYICQVEEKTGERNLDDYEEEYGYELAYMTLEEAIKRNEAVKDTECIPWITRDTLIMKKLIEMGY